MHEYEELVKDLRENHDRYFARDMQVADAIAELCRENESLAKCVNLASDILRKRWIPVTERLPEEMDLVLITDGINVMWSFRVKDFETSEFYGMWNVTHWMPLPALPREDGHA